MEGVFFLVVILVVSLLVLSIGKPGVEADYPTGPYTFRSHEEQPPAGTSCFVALFVLAMLAVSLTLLVTVGLG